ncbi:MAG: hypothetical protein QNJ94_16330 [Alphaproteobacteria bacterium]|nr:hypothetical protein [Alphaproteobacteria bacterium]
MNEKTVLNKIEEAETWHWQRLRLNTRAQWLTMIAVAIAGALTTFSGTPASEGTFVKAPEVIILLGIVAAVGSAINQFWNFSNHATRHRAAALGHRVVRLQLQTGAISEKKAVKIEAMIFRDPESALEKLAETSE